jgi:hypothetical protein
MVASIGRTGACKRRQRRAGRQGRLQAGRPRRWAGGQSDRKIGLIAGQAALHVQDVVETERAGRLSKDG